MSKLFQICAMDTNGGNKRTLLTEKNSISLPKALAVYDHRLYYLDTRYDKLERVDVNGENPRILLDNEPDLKTFTIFRKRPGFINLDRLNNFCLLYTSRCV